jgi:hypothetical protein
MRVLTSLLALSLLSLGLVGCEGGEESNTTVVAALSEAEAADLAACLVAIEECRLSGEACEDIVGCLPHRPESTRGAWERFCSGVRQRCADEELADKTTCAELEERCMYARLAAKGDQTGEKIDIELDPACMEALDACMSAGGDMDSCGTERDCVVDPPVVL